MDDVPLISGTLSLRIEVNQPAFADILEEKHRYGLNELRHKSNKCGECAFMAIESTRGHDRSRDAVLMHFNARCLLEKGRSCPNAEANATNRAINATSKMSDSPTHYGTW